MGNSVMLNGIEYAGEQIAYKDSTYELVSKVAYLIGVPLRIFQNEHEPPKIEIYNRLEQDKNARIIRNLCIIRTAIERNYRKINDIMRMEYLSLIHICEGGDSLQSIRQYAWAATQYRLQLGRTQCVFQNKL